MPYNLLRILLRLEMPTLFIMLLVVSIKLEEFLPPCFEIDSIEFARSTLCHLLLSRNVSTSWLSGGVSYDLKFNHFEPATNRARDLHLYW